MSKKDRHDLETDPRFPSGPWIGFFLQPAVEPGKHWMELEMTFCGGRLTAEGRDRVGKFSFDGTYSIETGKCEWSKHYRRKHCVFYKGFNEGKGIWGTWEIAPSEDCGPARGGFHIWPKNAGQQDQPESAAHVGITDLLESLHESQKPELAPVS